MNTTEELLQADMAREGAGSDGEGSAALEGGARAPEDDGEDFSPPFFEEQQECAALLADLAARLPPQREVLLPSVGQDPAGVAALVEVRFAKILARYQETPHLLFPLLEELMSPLVALLLRYLPPAAETSALLQRGDDSGGTATAAATVAREEAASAAGNTVVEANALGQNFDMFDSDAPKTPLHLVCRALYTIVKTAGEKCCTSYFPNEVKHYEDVYYAVEWWKRERRLQREWEVRYCLLLWLSNLVLVPFSLSVIDTNQTPGGAGAGGSLPLSDAVLATAVSFLSDSSKCRDGAALLVARLLTRPDSQRHRELFYEVAQEVLASHGGGGGGGGTAEGGDSGNFLRAVVRCETPDTVFADTFRLPGLLLAIAKTLKLGKREEQLRYASLDLIETVGGLLERAPADTLLCKCATKVVQRLVLVSLRKRRAAWRYQRHVASLASNLGAAETAAAAAQEEADADAAEAVEGDPECVEAGIGFLLGALGHKDTVVRWSAAKGVGRVCERLPQELATEVVAAVMECFASEHSDSLWHGALLALAELCRRGILAAGQLTEVVDVVARGLGFELSKGSYSVGAHVRDAACYTCWSLARAYDAADIEPHVHRLSAGLVAASLFDREVNVRRAAAAAFQECVGRLGNFPNGIDLVTTMDFFTLASLGNAYGAAASTVARLPAYRPRLLEELVSVKLSHWDRRLRAHAAGALGRLAALEVGVALGEVVPELLRRVEDPSVAARHGAVLGLAAIVRELPAECWGAAQREELVRVTVRLDSARLFRSRGAEYVRQACCELLAAVAGRRLELPDTLTVVKMNGARAKARTHAKMQEFFEDTWSNILEWVQASAAAAFAAYADAYYGVFQRPFHDKVLDKMIAGCRPAGQPPASPSPQQQQAAPTAPAAPRTTVLERRGYLAAVAGLPRALLLASPPADTAPGAPPYLLTLTRALADAAVLSEADRQDTELADAEARRNAVRSLCAIVARVAGPQAELPAGAATREWYGVAAGAVLGALDDYAADKRGDVGSFVRLAALQSLPTLVAGGVAHRLCPPALQLRFLRAVARLLLEKLDRVRVAAGAALTALLALDGLDVSQDEEEGEDGEDGEEGAAARAAELARLREVLRAAGDVDWSQTAAVLARMTPPLLLGCRRLLSAAALEGLVISAGDRSEHMSQPALAALLAAFAAEGAVEGEGAAERRGRLSRSLAALAARSACDERVLVPLGRAADHLLTRGALQPETHAALVSALRVALRHLATNIVALLPLVGLLGTLCLSPSPDARAAAWALALTMVASRYPRVRARMAADLYTALVAISAAEAPETRPQLRLEEAARVLADTQWDGSDAAHIRRKRNTLYPLLGLEPPAAQATSGTDIAAKKPKTEAVASTYHALVQETGY